MSKESKQYRDSVIWKPNEDYYITFYDGTWGEGAESEVIWPTEIVTERIIPLTGPTIIWNDTLIQNEITFTVKVDIPTTVTFNRVGILKGGKQRSTWNITYGGDRVIINSSQLPHNFNAGDRLWNPLTQEFVTISGTNTTQLIFGQSIFPPSGTGILRDASGVLVNVVYLTQYQTIYALSNQTLSILGVSI